MRAKNFGKLVSMLLVLSMLLSTVAPWSYAAAEELPESTDTAIEDVQQTPSQEPGDPAETEPPAEIPSIPSEEPSPSTEPGTGEPEEPQPSEPPFLLGEQLATDEMAGWIDAADTSWYIDGNTEFTISTAEELAGLAQLTIAGNEFKGKTITLGGDIDLAGKNWTCIGAFSGTFDGAGYDVKNMTMSGTWPEEHEGLAGLFSALNASAIVKNVNLSVGDITLSVYKGIAIGGLAGANKGLVQNCRITVTGIWSVSSETYYILMSGLTGWNKGTIEDCFVDILEGSKLEGTGVGNSGISAYASWDEGTIRRSRSMLAGELKLTAPGIGAGAGVGGFVANTVNQTCTFTDCYVIIKPTGKMELIRSDGYSHLSGVGGFIGMIGTERGIINLTNCYVYDEGAAWTVSGGPSVGTGIGSVSLAAGSTRLNNLYCYSANNQSKLVGSGTPATLNASFQTKDEMALESTYQGFDFAKTWIMDVRAGYPKIGTEADQTDEDYVAQVIKTLSFEQIRGANTDITKIVTDLSLITEGVGGTAISWSSSHPDVISGEGKVTRLAEDTLVTLTATVSKGTVSESKTFVLTVQKHRDMENHWSNFWADYWPNHDKLTWVAMGDSITVEVPRYLNGQQTYLDVTINRLNKELGKEIAVYNVGVSGQKMAYFDSIADTQVNNKKPEIVSVYLGMNDGGTELTSSKASLDSLINKLLPTKENVANKGTPADRVILLIACNPNNPADPFAGNYRQLHLYAQQRAYALTEQGYNVQFIDVFDYMLNEVDYTNPNNLDSLAANLWNGACHPNESGHLLAGQKLIKDLGLYSEDSEICTATPYSVKNQTQTPYVALDYTKAKLNLDGTAFTSAQPDSAGFTSMISSNPYRTMGIIGGEQTAGVGTHNSNSSWAEHVMGWSTGVFDQGSYQVQIPIFANGSYTVARVDNEIESIIDRHTLKFVLYMPEVSELYHEGYVHSQEKVDAYGSALTSILDKCAAKGVTITLVTPMPLNDAVKNGYLQDYVAKLIEVAEAKSASISNPYSVLKSAMDEAPSIGRNWYNMDGTPNYIMQLETAKSFLRGTMGYSNGSTLSYTYRNNSATSGTQCDNFDTAYSITDGKLALELSGLYNDAAYSGLTAANFNLEVTDAGGVKHDVSAVEYSADEKSVQFATDEIASGDTLRLKIVNGATTLANEFQIGTPLAGAVAITGTAKYGETLTADISGITTGGATYTYAWYREGVTAAIGTQSTYVLAEADIGKTVTLKVTGSGDFIGTLTSASTAAVVKADAPAAPAVVAVAPTDASQNDGKITGLDSAKAYQYKLSTVTDYTDVASAAEITGLVPGTYQVRLAETATHLASADAEVVIAEYIAGVSVTGTASFGAGTVPQISALTGADGVVIASDTAGEGVVNGDYTLTKVLDTDGEQHSVTFAITKTGEAKAAISVKLVDTSAEQTTDLSGVGIKFTAANLTDKTFDFELTTVTAGTYSVVTYKKNHTTATMTGVIVGETEVALGQTMPMLAGDLNDDGKVTIIDKGLLVNAFGQKAADADLDDNGTVAILDKGLLVNQFGKTNIVLQYMQ